jgi:hypothetical protein
MQAIRPMQSHDKEEFSPDIAAKTALLLLAVGLNAFEYLLPRIPVFPWLKPGLANIVTIVWIIRWGAADALVFSIVRSWITLFLRFFPCLITIEYQRRNRCCNWNGCDMDDFRQARMDRPYRAGHCRRGLP